jgi:hypothetical protein
MDTHQNIKNVFDSLSEREQKSKSVPRVLACIEDPERWYNVRELADAFVRNIEPQVTEHYAKVQVRNATKCWLLMGNGHCHGDPEDEHDEPDGCLLQYPHRLCKRKSADGVQFRIEPRLARQAAEGTNDDLELLVRRLKKQLVLQRVALERLERARGEKKTMVKPDKSDRKLQVMVVCSGQAVVV